MSAAGPPGIEEIIDQTGLDPMEARAIANAMQPLQDVTGVGSSVGSALSEAPGAGPRLIGIVLESIAQQVNMASTSAEALARGVEFYFEAQTGSLETLFPPPSVVADQVNDQTKPLVDALARVIDKQ